MVITIGNHADGLAKTVDDCTHKTVHEAYANLGIVSAEHGKTGADMACYREIFRRWDYILREYLHPLHAVNTEVRHILRAAGVEGHKVVPLVIPGKGVGRTDTPGFPVNLLFPGVVVIVKERYLLLLLDGTADYVGIQVDVLVHRLDPAGVVDVAAYLLALVDTCKRADLFKQFVGLLLCQETCRGYCVRQKPKLRKLEFTVHYSIADLVAPAGNYVQPEAFQRFNVLVKRLPSGSYAVKFELLLYLRHGYGVILVSHFHKYLIQVKYLEAVVR